MERTKAIHSIFDRIIRLYFFVKTTRDFDIMNSIHCRFFLSIFKMGIKFNTFNNNFLMLWFFAYKIILLNQILSGNLIWYISLKLVPYIMKSVFSSKHRISGIVYKIMFTYFAVKDLIKLLNVHKNINKLLCTWYQLTV